MVTSFEIEAIRYRVSGVAGRSGPIVRRPNAPSYTGKPARSATTDRLASGKAGSITMAASSLSSAEAAAAPDAGGIAANSGSIAPSMTMPSRDRLP